MEKEQKEREAALQRLWEKMRAQQEEMKQLWEDKMRQQESQKERPPQGERWRFWLQEAPPLPGPPSGGVPEERAGLRVRALQEAHRRDPRRRQGGA